MRQAIKALVPQSLKKLISIYRCHRAAVRYASEMDSIGQEIREDLLFNLKVVASRTQLLERLPKNATAAEIGVAEGEFSADILRICAPKKLHLIDLWTSVKDRPGSTGKAGVEKRFSKQISTGDVTLHQGCSWDILSTFDKAFFDWVYIDAAHDYASVKKDLAQAKRVVKESGFICGHDYVLWSCNGLQRFGVVEAVNEFCNENDYAMVYLTNQRNRHLSYALASRKARTA